MGFRSFTSNVWGLGFSFSTLPPPPPPPHPLLLRFRFGQFFVIGIALLPRTKPLEVSNHGDRSPAGLIGRPPKKPRIVGHRRSGRDKRRPEQVHGLPVVSAASAFPAQIGTDPPRAKEHRTLQF